MKKSRARRKFVNEMRGMGEMPWPARRFRYPATLGAGVPTMVKCPQLVEVDWKRRGGVLGWIRRPLAVPRVCGDELVLVPFAGGVLRCLSCKQRAKRERMEARILRPPATASTLALRAALEVARVSHRIFHRRSS